MIYNLSKMVLWQELKDVACLKPGYIHKINDENKERIGKALYINKDGIEDTLLRIEADNCTNLSNYYPLSSLTKEFDIKEVDKKIIINSENHTYFYGISMFILPEDFREMSSKNQSRVINILSEDECDEGYEWVVNITGSLRLASYDIEKPSISIDNSQF